MLLKYSCTRHSFFRRTGTKRVFGEIFNKVLNYVSDLQHIVREGAAESLWVMIELDTKMDMVVVDTYNRWSH